MPAQKDVYLSVQQLAKHLGLSVVTIYRLAVKHEIPTMKVGGQYRFSRALIDGWMQGKVDMPKGRPARIQKDR